MFGGYSHGQITHGQPTLTGTVPEQVIKGRAIELLGNTRSYALLGNVDAAPTTLLGSTAQDGYEAGEGED
jgi:hypothetical protein